MCNNTLHHRTLNSIVDPFAFSSFHLFRNCNGFVLPGPDIPNYYSLIKDSDKYNTNGINNLLLPERHRVHERQDRKTSSSEIKISTLTANDNRLHSSSIPKDKTPSSTSITKIQLLNGLEHSSNLTRDYRVNDLNSKTTIDISLFPSFLHKRQRGEKRPIPAEQKDEKYFERRKRNNEAAKKSRDARKMREDRIAFRAALLEQENSILRAQVLTLRDEVQTMRGLMGSTGPNTL